MDFSMIILTIGIPGSGKTTWVKEFAKKYPTTTFIVSSDEIRKELTGTYECNPEQNEMIHDEVVKRAKAILEDRKNYNNGTLGPQVIIDSTNVSLEDWKKFKNLHPSLMVAKVFDVQPQDAFKRQSGRERKVPMYVLQAKWNTLEENRKYIPLFFNMIL